MADIKTLFEAFHAAENVADILASFDTLRATAATAAGVSPHADCDAFLGWLSKHLAYKQQTYIGAIQTKWQRAAAWRSGSSSNDDNNKTNKGAVVISGGGPCGLRAACELALVMPRSSTGDGLRVHVVELRREATRHNVLKTWQPTFDDLVAWGLLMCTPGMQQQRRHGHLHVATRSLQVCLLKAALMLGVHVHFGWGVCGLVPPSSSDEIGWRVWMLPSDNAKRFLHETAEAMDAAAQSNSKTETANDNSNNSVAMPEFALKLGGEADVSRLQQVSKVDFVERAQSAHGAVLPPVDDAVWPYNLPMAASAGKLLPVDSLLVAEGESSRLIRRLGFDRHVMRYGEAIGIVINLDANGPHTTAAERQLPEFVVPRMSATWRDSPLGPLADQGILLENIEYMRGNNTHFIAATTKTATLHQLGVVRERLATTKATLAPSNVDLDCLRQLARKIASAVSVPETSPLCEHHGVQLFDYSCKGVCVESMRWLDAPDSDRRLPILPVGDALQNPYWPQGLGVNRGFHTALDAAWMAYERCAATDDVAEVERLHAFRTMQWQNFAPALLRPGAQWQIDPLTRYASTIQRNIHMFDIEQRSPQSSIPERYRKACKLNWPA